MSGAAIAMPIIQGGMKAGQTSDELNIAFKGQRDFANATVQYDQNVLASAAQSIGRLNVARAGMYRQATGALAAVRAKRKEVEGRNAVANAASDTVGASAQAAMQDTHVQADQAVAAVRYNLAVQDWNFDQQHLDILTAAKGQIRGDSLARVLSRQEADRVVFKGFLAGFGGAGGTIPGKPVQDNRDKGSWQGEENFQEDGVASDPEMQEYADQGESTQDWTWR